MLTRIFSGTIALAILIVLLLLPPYVLALTVLAASVIGLYEYSNAMKRINVHVDLPVSFIAALATVGRAYGSTLPEKLFPDLYKILSKITTNTNLNALAYIIIVYLFCRIIFQHQRFRIEDMAYTLFGILYIPFLLSFAVATRNLEGGFMYIWLIIIGSTVTDMFAYFIGVAFGKTRIVPQISPKKTVEGSIGGVLGCMLVMILYSVLVINRFGATTIPVYHFAILGLLCGTVSQLGDWAASALKRTTGIKDFGKLIPGHGGIMDRVDSILFVSPLVYIYVRLFL